MNDANRNGGIEFGTPKKVAPQPKLEFEEIEVGEVQSDGSAGPSKLARKLNNVFGVLLVALALASAIPAGSNVPIFWAFWSGMLFVMLAAHVAIMARIEPDRVLQVTRPRHRLAPLLCGVYLLWVLFQTLPIGLAAGLPGGGTPGSISVMADASLLGAIRQLGYLALFVLALEVAGRNDRVEFMTRLLFWGICLHALWAMVALRILGDIHWWGEKTAYQGVATGTFINRNNFAAFLGVGVVLGTAIVADLVNVPRVRKAGSTRNPRASLVEILVPVVGIALLIVTILATQSRMGLAAAFLGSVTVLGIMRVRQGRRAVLAAAEAFLVVVLVAMPLFALSGAGVLERSLDIGDEQNGRLVLWQQVLGMIGERPITGFGLDSFYPAFELFHRPPLTTALVWDYAHNSYLSLWLEAGILFGSLPIIAGAVLIWRSAVRAWQARTHFAVSAAGVGVGVLMLISSAVDFPLEIQANMFLFLLVMAIASADRRRRTDED